MDKVQSISTNSILKASALDLDSSTKGSLEKSREEGSGSAEALIKSSRRGRNVVLPQRFKN